jgi:phospholipid-binding lipoprotein MlaA
MERSRTFFSLSRRLRCCAPGRLRCCALAALAATALVSCSYSPEDEGAVLNDPLETVNRGVFSFNEVVDDILLQPVARAYRFAVPEYGRQRVSNVLSNLGMPITFLNSVLQGDSQNAFASLWSFVLNSTFGVAGVFDFSGVNTDLNVHREDFGQTLGTWGVEPGAYLVLPILGPSSLRDTVGLAGDGLADPFNHFDDEIIVVRTIATAIDTRAGTLDLTDEVYRASLDPYASFRSGYLQKREAMVKNTHSQETK